MNDYTERLFSYGTLQYERVQLSTFGRKLKGSEVLSKSGDAVHPIVIYTGNRKDKIEVNDYKRVHINLDSGVKAWVYVSVKEEKTHE